MKISLLEKIAIGWGIPINTIGYAYVNHANILETLFFYWNHKLEQYEKLVEDIQQSKDISEKIEKYMPVLCYRFMIKLALKRTGMFSEKEYNKLCKKYPLDLDKTFNPKHIPRQ